MNSIKYSEWAAHYDPKNLEIQLLHNHGLSFKGTKVLEIGCGTGRFTKRIIDSCSSITCIDPDVGAVSLLQTSIISPKLRVICGTLETIVLENDYYDYVIFPWSLYLIPNQYEVLSLSKQYLKPGGRIIVLQAKSGEYEEEISVLYNTYDSMGVYSQACASLPALVSSIFGNISTDTLNTYFEFDSIEQVVDCSLFFIEDEEGQPPCESDISKLRERLLSYLTPNGKIIMSDIVTLIIAEKEKGMVDKKCSERYELFLM